MYVRMCCHTHTITHTIQALSETCALYLTHTHTHTHTHIHTHTHAHTHTCTHTHTHTNTHTHTHTHTHTQACMVSSGANQYGNSTCMGSLHVT